MPDSLGERLRQIWTGQKGYNDRVKSVQKESRWGEIYLLGLVSEVNEILDATGWKRHRRGLKPNKANIGRELADATKYLLSLWQEYGFSLDDMLMQLENKQAELDWQWAHDWQPPNGSHVIVTDLDGTVADYRTSFSKYAQAAGYDLSKTVTLQQDVDNGVSFEVYAELKDRFEREGGYAEILPYEDAVDFLRSEGNRGAYLYVTTARPADRFQRIWQDTAKWLKEHGIPYNGLRFGDDIRLEELTAMRDRGNKVVLLEDNPTMAMRAALMGIRVYLRSQPYNQSVSHPNITRCESFANLVDWEAV